MIMKRKNVWNEFKDASVTPADSLASETPEPSLFASETPGPTEAPGPSEAWGTPGPSEAPAPSEKVPQHVSHFFAHTASKRPKTERKKVNVFSLHGYSSLRMVQDGPKACCKEKVGE